MKQQTLKQIAELPTLTVEKMVRNGTHQKIVLNTPVGQRTLVISLTASDWRAEKNSRAILRRWARGEA